VFGVDFDVLERDITPIFLARGDEPLAFVGTGFLLARHVFVTCWHCVEKRPDPGCHYIAAPREAGHFTPWPLVDLEQDRNGADLALARVEADPHLGLIVSSEGRLIGNDVWTYGFPLTEPRREQDGMHFTLHGRALRGYATRTFNFTHPRFGQVSSYELDMPTPAGLSGAPLLLANTREVIGVVYGSHQVQVADDAADADHRKGLSNLTFGLAHRSKTLRAASGSSTEGVGLAEYLGAA
jgi:hypothetical protein